MDRDIEVNKSVVRQFISATNEQNFGAYDELLSDHMVSHFPGGVTLDRGQTEDGERSFAAAFPDIVRTIEDLVAEGDKIVARTSLVGTHQGQFQGIAATGREVRITALAIYRVENGKITESWVEADFLGLMAQINDSTNYD